MRQIAQLSAASMLVASTSAQAGGGMPQMDPTWFANGFLWLGVSFVFLYLMVSHRIVPSIASVLSARELAISGAIAEAQKAKLAAESTSGNVESASHAARVQAAETMAKMQAEISAESAKAIAKLEHDLERKADHAAAVLHDTVRKASAEIDAAAEDLAQSIANKLVATAANDSVAATTKPKRKAGAKS